MQPEKKFVGLPKEFWANIRTISQGLGYVEKPKRGKKGEKGQVGRIKVPSLSDIKGCLESINLSASHLVSDKGEPTDLGRLICDYFQYRADLLNNVVEPLLMNAAQAEALYQKIQEETKSRVAIPMNKQSEEKKKPAFFTGMINMIIDAAIQGLPCNFDPRELTTVTRNRQPFRTLARRIDGAFPGPVDPIAVWEIKEYYYTTTFGSRVADGVYESLLDGMELQELDEALRDLADEGRPKQIEHLLMVDAHFTWWIKGRSYLCRIIDMLHMGYVDEVLFGREIETRLPVIAQRWAEEYRTVIRS